MFWEEMILIKLNGSLTFNDILYKENLFSWKYLVKMSWFRYKNEQKCTEKNLEEVQYS